MWVRWLDRSTLRETRRREGPCQCLLLVEFFRNHPLNRRFSRLAPLVRNEKVAGSTPVGSTIQTLSADVATLSESPPRPSDVSPDRRFRVSRRALLPNQPGTSRFASAGLREHQRQIRSTRGIDRAWIGSRLGIGSIHPATPVRPRTGGKAPFPGT